MDVQRYNEFGGPSGVHSYEIGETWIVLHFHEGAAYRYTYTSCGREDCERMKQLALQGAGLNTFVNQTRPSYEEKMPY